jgi:hypothetical protein
MVAAKMNNLLVYLNLPPLSTEISDQLTKFAMAIPPDSEGQKWLEEFHSNEIHSISVAYGRVPIPDQLQQEIRNIYSVFFGEEVKAVVANLSNTYGDRLAESPPHCDRARKVSINYILQTGGDNVRTCFFNEKRKGTDLTAAENLTYDQLTRNFDVCLPYNTWHSFDVQTYHSVENIESTRVLFSLILPSNPDFITFKEKYKDIIIQQP